MIGDQFWDLRAEFTRPYSIDVEIRGDNGVTLTRTRVVDGLLDQLAAAASPGGSDPTSAGGGGYGSRPPVRVGAVSLLDEITRTLRAWSLHYAGRATPTPALSLAELARVLPAMDSHAVGALVDTMTGWRTRARWVLGWDSPPFAPHVPCPQCLAFGALRLWAAERHVSCLSCGSWWDSSTLADLRDRLRLSRDLAHAA
jgi:Zn ribbon nucleic-acid-binding protein